MKRARAEWLYPRDIADLLDVTRQHASRLIRRIPGAEMLYPFEGRKGERWRVSRAAYDAWRATVPNVPNVPVLTGSE